MTQISILNNLLRLLGTSVCRVLHCYQKLFSIFFQPIRSPLAPSVLITGIVPSESSIFKSALHPLRLTFRTANGGHCKVMFKKGDDIRQDQLVIDKILMLH